MFFTYNIYLNIAIYFGLSLGNLSDAWWTHSRQPFTSQDLWCTQSQWQFTSQDACYTLPHSQDACIIYSPRSFTRDDAGVLSHIHKSWCCSNATLPCVFPSALPSSTSYFDRVNSELSVLFLVEQLNLKVQFGINCFIITHTETNI